MIPKLMIYAAMVLVVTGILTWAYKRWNQADVDNKVEEAEQIDKAFNKAKKVDVKAVKKKKKVIKKLKKS